MSLHTSFWLKSGLALVAAALIALTLVAAQSQNEAPNQSTAAARIAAACASERVSAMVGQTIMVGFPGTEESDEGVRAVRTQLGEGHIGGVVLFPENIRGKAQLARLIGSLRGASSSLLPFVAVDQEGGKVQRLTSLKGFASSPAAAEVGKEMSPASEERAEAIYRAMAEELAGLGFNMNLGPVIDLNTNPDNPVIGARGRSFGADADRVALIAGAFIRAHHAANIATVAKHFPGHGSSVADSHRKLADISQTWDEGELAPYRRLNAQGLLDAVMIGHLYHPRFSDLEGLPATLSAKAVTALRASNGLGFDGVIISDDMEMGAVRDAYSPEELAVRAIQSGTDVLIFSNVQSQDPALGSRLHSALLEAVCDGRIGIARLEEAYGRIVRLKQQLKSKKWIGAG